MFLQLPAHLGSPGQRAIKRLLLLLLQCHERTNSCGDVHMGRCHFKPQFLLSHKMWKTLFTTTDWPSSTTLTSTSLSTSRLCTDEVTSSGGSRSASSNVSELWCEVESTSSQLNRWHSSTTQPTNQSPSQIHHNVNYGLTTNLTRTSRIFQMMMGKSQYGLSAAQ